MTFHVVLDPDSCDGINDLMHAADGESVEEIAENKSTDQVPENQIVNLEDQLAKFAENKEHQLLELYKQLVDTLQATHENLISQIADLKDDKKALQQQVKTLTERVAHR